MWVYHQINQTIFVEVGMYEVLYEPFPDWVKRTPFLFVCLVDTEKRRKLIGFSWVDNPDIEAECRVLLEALALDLNDPPSREYRVLLRRSIRREGVYRPHRPTIRTSGGNFRADFGRRDFSSPGRGGSGFDGYW